MKVGRLSCLLLLALCSGCVDLSKPKAVAACAANNLCSDQTSDGTGGLSGNKQDSGSDGVGNADIAIGGPDTSAGGGNQTGGISGSGGLVGSDGTIVGDGAAGAGGMTGAGGGSSVDGAVGAGGVQGAGGTLADGAIGTGGIKGMGGSSTVDGAVATGGVTGSGGGSSVGGALGTGGGLGSGGKTATGGAVGTGGIAGTGGSTVTGCGQVASTFSQTFSFASGLGTLTLATNSASGSKVSYVTAGPASKTTLCSPTTGCAALSLPFASGAAAYTAFALAVENFAPAVNLVGSTVTFSVAIDNPGTTPVPIQIQAYAQGDATANYAWTVPATVGGASLTAYAAATGFQDLVLPVTNNVTTVGKYCAAVTGAIGIQVQNTAAIASSNAGTVTVYISKITLSPP